MLGMKRLLTRVQDLLFSSLSVQPVHLYPFPATLHKVMDDDVALSLDQEAQLEALTTPGSARAAVFAEMWAEWGAIPGEQLIRWQNFVCAACKLSARRASRGLVA